MGLFGRDKTMMIDPADALPGRDQEMPVPEFSLCTRQPAEAAVP